MGLCERCNKAQATFHLTNIDRDGNKLERHLCDRCAAEEGLLQTGKAAIVLDDILQKFVAQSKGGQADVANLVCEECGISYVEFRNQGLLGCPHDYEVFKEVLSRLVERTHDGATQHAGKVPRSLGGAPKKQQDIRRLKRMLDEAVAGEDYERAAELRDRIQELENS